MLYNWSKPVAGLHCQRKADYILTIWQNKEQKIGNTEETCADDARHRHFIESPARELSASLGEIIPNSQKRWKGIIMDARGVREDEGAEQNASSVPTSKPSVLQ